MNLSRRDLKPGTVYRVHLKDGTSAQGRLVRVGRAFLHFVEHRLEAGGVLHELKSEALLIPADTVKALEVIGS